MRARTCLLVAMCLVGTAGVQAQDTPWIVWESDEVDSRCGIINTVKFEFVVRTCDDAFVLVSGQDAGFSNTRVTDDGQVLIDEEFAGWISYEEDADGFYTLWWVDDEGFVVTFDDANYEPLLSDVLPDELQNVPCAVEQDAIDEDGYWQGDANCGEPFGKEFMLPLELGFEDDRGPGDTCGIGSVSLVLFTCLGMWLVRRR